MICVNRNNPPPSGDNNEKTLHEEIKELVALLDEGITELMGQPPIPIKPTSDILKEVKLDKVPDEVGVFKGLGDKIKNVSLPDQEFVLLLHEWIMKSLEHLSYLYEYDMVDVMIGKTPISIDASSEKDWVNVCISHGTKIHHKLTLKFTKK